MKPLALSLALGIVASQTSPDNPRNRHNVGPEHFTMRVVATALGNPWEITWGPDGYLWVTERSAFRVTRINPADGSQHVALTLDDAYTSVDQDGLQQGVHGHGNAESRMKRAECAAARILHAAFVILHSPAPRRSRA